MTAVDFPFDEVCESAELRVKDGWFIYQKWTCGHCGARQTMPDANHFYEIGLCEECDSTTNIRERGCNYMATTFDISELIT